MNDKLAALLLCGGQSTRMGQDKGSLAFVADKQPVTLRDWMDQRWRRHCDPVLWSVRKPASPPDPQEVPDLSAYQGQGPLAGLLSGLWALQERPKAPEFVLALAVDMPGFEPRFVPPLLEAMRPGIDAAHYGGQGPASLLGAVLRTSTVREVAQSLLDRGERRMRALASALDTRELPPPAGVEAGALVSGLNTPQDWKTWLQRRGFAPSNY